MFEKRDTSSNPQTGNEKLDRAHTCLANEQENNTWLIVSVFSPHDWHLGSTFNPLDCNLSGTEIAPFKSIQKKDLILGEVFKDQTFAFKSLTEGNIFASLINTALVN